MKLFLSQTGVGKQNAET